MGKRLRTISSGQVLGKFVLGFGLMLLPMAMAFATPSGFEYRSAQTGQWHQVSTWERRVSGSANSWSPITLSEDLPDATAGTIVVLSGHNVTLAANATADQVTVQSGATLTVNSGVTFTVADDAATGNDLIIAGASASNQGVLQNAGTILTDPGAKINVSGYGIYKHNYTTTYGEIPVITWAVTSTLEIMSYTSPAGVPLGFNQSFGNIRWNTPALNADIDLQGAFTNTVRGNFEVVTTNNKKLNLSGSTAYSLIILGDLIISNGANLNISNGTVAGRTFGLTLKGNLNVAAGGTLQSTNSVSSATLTFGELNQVISGTGTINTTNIDILVNSASTATLSRNLTMESGRTLTVGGRLNMGTSVIDGAGNFSLNTAGILGVGSPAGISASGATGNVQVTGTKTFRVSTYIYNGTSAQVTGDGLPTNIDKFEINNAAGVTLSGPLNLNSLLTLTNGVIKTASSSNLTVKNTGSITYPASGATSFVEGPVRITVLSSSSIITFPVGSGGAYTPVQLEAFQVDPGISTIYEAQEFKSKAPAYPINGASTGTNTIDRVSMVRYYKVVCYGTNFDYGKVTLPVSTDDGVNDFSKLVVAGVEGATWYDFGRTAYTGTTSSGTITSDYIFGLGEFSLANKTGGSNPLPVELINFSARKTGQDVTLNWQTASEKKSAWFIIERSYNAREFEAIGQVAAAGASNSVKRYVFTDKNYATGLVYYRLKQVDLDGSFNYSEMLKLRFDQEAFGFDLFPNPVISELQLTLQNKSGATYKVISALGQVVLTGQVSPGQNYLRLNLEALPAAPYILQLEQEGRVETMKIVKRHR